MFVTIGALFSMLDLFDFNEDMVEYAFVATLGGLFLFAIQFISLRRSFMKNKDIM
ncbi:MAG: hypothetical protein ABS882_04535 [Lysinibacillus sp.]